MKLRRSIDPHTGSQHLLIGVTAIVTGVALGVFIVSLNAAGNQDALVHAQGAPDNCQKIEEACMNATNPKRTHEQCHQYWLGCMGKCTAGPFGGTGLGRCSIDPECQASCTENATSQGGRISCCEGGPKHVNNCPDMIDGKCKPTLQGPPPGGMMPMMMPGMGGLPMLPMLPMMMPGMGGMPSMPMPSDPCAARTVGWLSDAFGSDCVKTGTTTASTTNPIKKATSFITDQLTSFFSFGDDKAPATVTEIKDPLKPQGSGPGPGGIFTTDVQYLSGSSDMGPSGPTGTSSVSYPQPLSTFGAPTAPGQTTGAQGIGASLAQLLQTLTNALKGLLGNIGS